MFSFMFVCFAPQVGATVIINLTEGVYCQQFKIIFLFLNSSPSLLMKRWMIQETKNHLRNIKAAELLEWGGLCPWAFCCFRIYANSLTLETSTPLTFFLPTYRKTSLCLLCYWLKSQDNKRSMNMPKFEGDIGWCRKLGWANDLDT